MDLDEEDPLLLFTGGRADGCLGEWKNDRLQVLIRLQEGRLVLESGKKELQLLEAGVNEWNVADAAQSPVYLCKVMGYGRDTRLTLEPPKHKGGNFKATLRRVEHIGLPEAETPVAITDHTSGACEAPLQRAEAVGAPGGNAMGGVREDRAAAGGSWDRSRGAAGSRSASRESRHGGGRRRGGPGGGRRSRSPRRRSPPPRRDSGGGDEVVTTLFVSGLPGDAREEEVRRDCEWVGPVGRVVLMKRGSERNAFVRFGTLQDARRAMDRISDGEMQICQTRVKAEMARRNTN